MVRTELIVPLNPDPVAPVTTICFTSPPPSDVVIPGTSSNVILVSCPLQIDVALLLISTVTRTGLSFSAQSSLKSLYLKRSALIAFFKSSAEELAATVSDFVFTSPKIPPSIWIEISPTTLFPLQVKPCVSFFAIFIPSEIQALPEILFCHVGIDFLLLYRNYWAKSRNSRNNFLTQNWYKSEFPSLIFTNFCLHYLHNALNNKT